MSGGASSRDAMNEQVGAEAVAVPNRKTQDRVIEAVITAHSIGTG